MTFIFLLLIFSLPSHSSARSTTLSLSPTALPPPLQTDLWQKLRHLSAASSARAHNLKHPQSNPTTTTTTTTTAASAPLFPRGYGGYSISLGVGTPPQNLSFLMDTGSSLLWFPCTQRYSCSSCSFPGSDPASLPVFIPRSSSTSRIVGCRNPSCKWIFPDVQCRECAQNATTCSELCPPYIIQYGSGSTTGLLLSDSLNLPGRTVENFTAGCSVFSTRQPEGIAGFGRGPQSLPSQLGLTRFSYCLVSHRFDDSPASSDLVLTAATSRSKTAGAEYTPFRQNTSTGNPAFGDYYYITLRKITVGGVNVKAPYEFLAADASGKGGTIVDSGTTFTYMDKGVFEPLEEEFVRQVGRNYSRTVEVEKRAGLRPCFNVSGEETITLPQLTFHFKGGAEMVLPLADYFSFSEESVVCMTIVTSDGALGGGVGPGPSIILGNYQQQNFYVEYDLENDRFGFKRQLCR
ncbi:Eukaryotic aspartyl protease family protein [Striga hermonthica]|uniref:Eukaryotic aspartyl protease family protein n=1 Tax=Striga hermonthica TaxID=68872 RepID=A0A9N7N002_STRHE|nr:Eukaryotic aspartyl protease family protein [Striga hermonthica]